MKIINIMLKSSVCALAALSAVVLSLDTAVKQPQSTETPGTKLSDTEPTGYLIKEYNGKIAVFSKEGTSPLYTFESPYVRDLPEYDRKLLKEGIFADSNAKLLEILQDYDF
ncbi:MAG: hypothetical protein IJA41_07200 [Clostridia bacterium]|nr:hypothetical protein [Clostridia bacterium]